MFTFTGDGKEHQQSSTLVLTQLLPVLATASPNHGTQAHPPSSQATRGEGGQWKGLRLSGSPTDSPATPTLRPCIRRAQGGTPAGRKPRAARSSSRASHCHKSRGGKDSAARASHGGERSGTQTHCHTPGPSSGVPRACFSTDRWPPLCGPPLVNTRARFVRLLQATILLTGENHPVQGGWLE